MLPYLVSCASLAISLFAYAADATSSPAAEHFSINCGSTATSAALSGREWLGDHLRPESSKILMKGTSVSSSVREELWNNIDPVPYRTARVSTSQFSYSFHLSPGQKFIRLHFNPASYYGDRRFKDLFTVEAGPFILLSDFSASKTARSLGHNPFTKEYCVAVQENQPLNFVFSPAGSTSPSKDQFYAFINGIEIISVPFGLSYCHVGDVGVQVVGQKSVLYIDNANALELVHRLSLRWDSDDVVRGSTFGLWDAIHEERANKNNNITWRVSVDVGFSYLVRLRFSEAGLKLCKNFVVTVNLVTVTTRSDVLKDRGGDNGTLWYTNYMVYVRGHDPEAKGSILISLHSKDGLVMGSNGPLDGFEVFKLSNDANSLASSTSNYSPTTQDLPSQTSQGLLTLLGSKNSVAAVVIAAICLINSIAYKLREKCGFTFCGEEDRPTIRGKYLCRRFSLREMQSATDNFHDALLIGKGGFGNVYKGFIDNKQQKVAVKRQKSGSSQGEREFWAEIEALSQLRHVNLVSLIGYCYEQKEMILVYEYVPSGTLADQLYKLARKGVTCSPLSWKQRLHICIGGGRGLDYLHTGHGIIHRDIKTSNILLDETSVPKISDFGLAKTRSVKGDLQRQASASVKGTFGYLDPNYYRTSVLTTKSDTFSFGVVLLEVLCGRPAVEPTADEDTCSLTKWARNYISKGEVYKIVDPNIRDEVSFSSLKTFVRIAERCLEDSPEKRPAIAHILINLEFALEQQENVTPLSLNGITSVSEFFPGTDHKPRKGNSKPLLNNVITSVTTLLACYDATISSDNSGEQATSPLKDHDNSKMFSTLKRDMKKTKMRNILRLWPFDASRKIDILSNQKNTVGVSVSEPLSCGTSMQTTGTKPYDSLVFNFRELKKITTNFSTVIGEGGFGKVYKGWLDKRWICKAGVSIVAVKRLSSKSCQGFKEWQNEVEFLQKFSHPNLVRLLGYCREDNELLLVYEYMSKGCLDVHIFKGESGIEPLGWNRRLTVLIGVARGLAFLHESDRNIVHRDIKTTNILLDEWYQAKITDFGLATLVPTDSSTHLTTRVIGTYGYAAPDYVATGHLTAKSDAYSFGVVIVEVLTGLRAVDRRRPAEKQNLVEWIKPLLGKKRKMKLFMDSRLDGKYPTSCAFEMGRLAFRCLESEPKRRPSLQEIVEELVRLERLLDVSMTMSMPTTTKCNTNQ